MSYFNLEIFCGVVGYVASKTIDFENAVVDLPQRRQSMFRGFRRNWRSATSSRQCIAGKKPVPGFLHSPPVTEDLSQLL